MGMALYSTLTMAVLLLVISGLVPLAERLRLPLAGLGVALGAFAFSSGTPFLAGIFGDVFFNGGLIMYRRGGVKMYHAAVGGLST